MTKIVNFGGSSLADAKQFKKVKDIIFADESRKFVVPSAPAKRDKNGHLRTFADKYGQIRTLHFCDALYLQHITQK